MNLQFNSARQGPPTADHVALPWRLERLFLVCILLTCSTGTGTNGASAATPVSFTGGELLGKPTAHSIAINIIPDSTIEYYYQYGLAPGSYAGSTAITTALGGQPSEVTLIGLTPNSRYYYRMRYRLPGETDWVERAEAAFSTQRAAGSTFPFTVTSDSHHQFTPFYLQAMANVAGSRPDFHLDLGDTFGTDFVSSQSGANARYMDQRNALYLGAIGSWAPIFLASGNHENEEGWNLDDTNSLGIFSIQARKAFYPTPVTDGFYSANNDPLASIDETAYGDELREDYYAWTWGSALFVVIDPFQYTLDLPYPPTSGEKGDDLMTGDQWSWTLGKQQFSWLRQTLESSHAPYKFVFSHQMTGGIPRDIGTAGAGYVRGGAEAAGYFEWGGRNADGTPGFSAHRAEADFGTTPIHQLLLDNDVSAVFHGHDHIYAYETRDGLVYQAVPPPATAGDDFPGIYIEGDHGDYQTNKVLDMPGHLMITVGPDHATVEHVRSDATGIAYSYTLAAHKPETALDSAPPNLSGSADATFTFSSDEPDVTFACQLDGMGFAACTSPQAYPGLSDGPHVFEVRAIDAYGGADPTPASHSWVIDTRPPALLVTGATADSYPMTGSVEEGFVLETANEPAFDRAIQFATGTSADEPLADDYFGLYLTGSTVDPLSLQAYYDARQVPEPYLGYLKSATVGVNPFVYIRGATATLVDAAKHDLQGMDVDMTVPDDYPLGTYTVAGNIRDPAGNLSPVTLILIVASDVTPPETTIDGGPADPSGSTEAIFTFSGNESRLTYACQLDAGAFETCTSPQSYAGLAQGPHLFHVRATDAADNTDPTPAGYAWTVELPPLELTALTLKQSVDKLGWVAIPGDLAEGYTMPLDPVHEWYYLDVAALEANRPLADGYSGFTLGQTDLPAGWLDYWAQKGVIEGAAEPWQQEMWRIINGDAPIFYLHASAGAYALVDGLGYALSQPDDFLRVNGDYPLGTYAYVGEIRDLVGDTLAVTAHMSFIGPFPPAAPVVTIAEDGGDVRLDWPAITTDAAGNFTVVTAYEVFRESLPYFAPDPTPGTGNLVQDSTDLEYLHQDAAATPAGYYYLVLAMNVVGPSTESKRVGVFSFQMTPGSIQ